MIKRIFFLFLLHSSFFLLYAQNSNDSLLYKPLSFNKYVDFWSFMNYQHAGFSLGVGFYVVKPIRSFSFNQTYGIKYPMKAVWFPLIFEMGFVRNWLTAKPQYPIPVYQSKNYSILRDGISFSLSICPLPRFSYWSEKFVPYIGAGYQFSDLRLRYKNKAGKYSTISSIDFSSMIIKMGCLLYVNKVADINIDIEYGINRDKKLNFIGLNFDISFNIFNEMFRELFFKKSKKLNAKPNIFLIDYINKY